MIESMEIWHAIVYGLVEGITEFLPISSTGHLLLATHILGDDSTFIKSFEIMIQLGAILAIVCLYPKRLLTERATILRVASAFIPTAILGLLFYKIIKTYLLGNVGVVLGALFLGGVIIILIERSMQTKNDGEVLRIQDLSLIQSAMLGVVQCIAFIPGVSRSAATIFGGMFFGLARQEAVEFSFFLAVPTMAAATGLDLLKNYHAFTRDNISFLGVGFVTSFVVALLAARWLTHYVGKHDFTGFGYYRILVAIFGFFFFFY
jgi:undecaprenyl-diphosphatase